MFKTFKSALFVGASLSALAVPALAQQTAQADTEAVIVTGTRVTGMTAADSAAPVTVLGSDALSHVGQPNLSQSLAQNIPSFNAEAHGGDTGALTMSARLRGLSPNDTLVLIDGKRRHSTANLHVLGGQFQGAATADLDLIPTASIDHIEVLQDGAAAQYGTDAIAGVVNIILKKNSEGGILTGSGGKYMDGGGETYDFSGNIGFPLGSKGFINFTGEKRFRGFSQRGFGDTRVVNPDGTAKSVPYNATGIPGYPNINPIDGDPESQLTTVFFNAAYDVAPELQLYSYGSYGRRIARAFENDRVPSTVIALGTSNQAFLAPGTANPGYTSGTGTTCTTQATIAANGINPCYQTNPSGSYTTPGEAIFSTTGFKPQETLKEDDWSYTFGAKGDVSGWNWDLSGTYGKDINKIGTSNSANTSLYIDTHTTPTEFYDGSFIASELTGNFDVTKNFNVGLATPLSVAVGFEAREDTYAITPGDPASYYKTGAQSFPGYSPTGALAKSRKNYAEYIDLAVSPIQDLQIDIAGRHEYYTDFHDAQVGKVTARYDFSPAFAIRGTLATGFRAPTLPESYYTQTNVSPTSATVQIGPNSPAALKEGLSPLKPESSVNYSLGFVAHLFDNLSATLDGYSIAIGNRIVGTGTVNCKATNVVVNQTVCDAITANGNNLDPSVTTTGTTVFQNSVSTLTHGVDFTANYASDFDSYGSVTWTAAANWGETSVSRIAPNPVQLGTTSLFTPGALSILTNASPKYKISLGALWTLDDWTVNLRETIYGPSSQLVTPSIAPVTYYKQGVSTAGITDVEVSKDFDFVTATVGANNLFNKNPETIGLAPGTTTPIDNASIYYEPNSISPYGINGGFYYGRVTIHL
jgi:iron complex outermembrane receptor protein